MSATKREIADMLAVMLQQARRAGKAVELTLPNGVEVRIVERERGYAIYTKTGFQTLATPDTLRELVDDITLIGRNDL